VREDQELKEMGEKLAGNIYYILYHASANFSLGFI
jgi:hypothetical protein